MGLLDDAIREHLDLKRRRGADPAEVARMEQEALGPVRREPRPGEASAEQAQEPAPAPPEQTQASAVEHTPEPAPAAREEPHAAPAAEAAPVPAPAEHSDRPHPAAEDLHPDEHTHALAPEDRHEPPHGDPLLQPTTEYRVEDHHHDDESEPAPPHEAPADDVLEETPDFLQETPEHDRLWFEQRPPRDFDFDG